jgi:hypothetical protein
MRRWCDRAARACRASLVGLGLGATVAAAQPPTAPAPAARGPLDIARVSLVERRVELEKRGGGRWQNAVEGGPLAIGEALRTGPDAVARLELPWMSLMLSPASVLRFPDAFLLQATLESGRARVDAPELDALKLVTGEAEVRGRGRAVVRRQGTTTLVTCLAGRFFVDGAGTTVTLSAGRGTVVAAGRAPESPREVPAAPAEGLWPAQDPVYVAPTEPVELRWKGSAAGYQVELLPVGSDVVLLQRDVTASPVRIEVPWEGAFRWRVSARDASGLEGLPSADGLIAVDAR